jgi:hypothetical protein
MTEKEAGQIVTGIIQSYIGPDHRVMDMQSFYRVLVQALQTAHERGWQDRAEAEKPTSTRGARFGGRRRYFNDPVRQGGFLEKLQR